MFLGLIPNLAQRRYRETINGMASGDPNAPSAAQGMLNQGLARTRNNNIAMAGMNTSNPLLAQRNAANANAEAGAAMAMNAAQMRSQEQMQALQAQNAIGSQQAAGANNAFGTLMNLGQSAAGMGALLSDERTKTDRRPGSSEARSFLSELDPEQFAYKAPEDAQRFGEGDQLGVMAQQLARTPSGRQMLIQDEQGRLAIDPARSIGPSLASMAYLFDRVERLEGRRTDAGPTGERKEGEPDKAREDTLAMSDRATGYNPEEDAARSLLAALDSPQGVGRRGRSGRGRGRASRGRVAPPTEPFMEGVPPAADLPDWNSPPMADVGGPWTAPRASAGAAPGGFSEAFNQFGQETGAFSPFRLRMPAPQEDGPMSVDPMMSFPRGR